MPANITDVSTFTDPIVMPADTDAADLTYIETAVQGLANRTRAIADLLGNVDAANERTIALGDMRPINSSSGVYDPGWTLVTDGTGYCYWVAEALSRWILVPLNAYLRHGQVLTNVRVMVKPGESRATAGDRMSARLFSQQPAFVGVGIGGNPPTPTAITATVNETAAGTASNGIDLESALGAGHTVVLEGLAAVEYYLLIKSGNTLVGTLDALHGVKIYQVPA